MAIIGWRKVIIFTESLASFTFLVWALQLNESAAIISLGGAITMLLGSAIWGNVQSKKFSIEPGKVDIQQ